MMELRKATKKQAKIKVALVGPSGSGKTYSALLLARGMADWGKICVIDTENGSADLYSHLGEYNVITLAPPFTPERYVEAIETAERNGMEIIVIDSISHEWEGKGGILEVHDSMMGNSYTNWGKITPRHNAFIDRIVQSKCHIIATFRAKQDYVLGEVNGKQVPQKVGLKAISREGVDYEFTLGFDLNIKHMANASKDRTSLFIDKPEFMITSKTGETLKKWAEDGIMETAELLTETQNKRIHVLISETKADREALKKHFEVKSMKDMTRVQAEQAIKMLLKKQALMESEKESTEVVNEVMEAGL